MNRWLPLVCTLLYVVLFVLVHGYFFHVDAMLLLFHLHPFFLLPPDVQYLHGSPLVPIVAHYLGIAGYVSMRLFYLLLVCAAVCSVYFYTKDLAEKEKEEEQKKAHVVLLLTVALSPLLFTLLSAMGKPDPLLVVLYIWFLWGRKSFVIKNGAVFFMLLTHREMALCMLLAWWLLYRPKWKETAALLPGALLAFLWFALYTSVLGGFADRVAYIATNKDLLLVDIRYGMLPILLTSFSWFWIMVGGAFWKDPQNRLRYAGAVLLTVGMAAITTDHSRIASLVGLPLVLFVLERIIALGLIDVLYQKRWRLFAASMLSFGYGTSTLIFSYWPIFFAAHPALLSQIARLL